MDNVTLKVLIECGVNLRMYGAQYSFMVVSSNGRNNSDGLLEDDERSRVGAQICRIGMETEREDDKTMTS